MNYYIISLINIILGTIITMSASSWLMAWIGLELNLMSFMPWIKNKNNSFSMEASMKYFIIQATTSSIFIMLTIFHPYFNFSMTLFSHIMFFILVMKMAMAPLHFWLVPLIDSMNWNTLMSIMTWQKIAPISIIMMLPYISITFIIISLMLSPFLSLNQTSLKKLMTFSSITHLSWIMMSSFTSKLMTLTYFMMYSLSSLITIFMLMPKISLISQINTLPKKLYYMFSLNILSLSGFPPFSMFFPKIMVILNTMPYSLPMTIILIWSSLLSLYSYLRVIWSINLKPSNFSKFSISSNKLFSIKYSYIFLMFITPMLFPLLLTLNFITL